MEVFDTALDKAKDVLTVAYKKTEEMVTTGKQKFDIAAIKAKLSKDYEKLGKIYFEQIKDSDTVEGTVLNLKNAILEKQNNIEKIKEEMNNK